MTDFGLFQTASLQMIRLLESAQSLALTPAPILISGEQGVGKTLLLQMILEKSRHQKRLHRWGPYTRFAAGFPEDIKSGDAVVIEALDEMNLMQQSDVSEKIDLAKSSGLTLRWFATSSADPAELMRQGQLRRDLFYRLSVVHLQIPSLRKRPEDIEVLAHFFVQVFSLMKNQKPLRISPEAQAKMLNHAWPGNVAELENVIERAVSVTTGEVITPEQVQFCETDTVSTVSMGTTLEEMERKLILQTLQITHQNKTKAAQMLGISIRTLRNKLNEYRESGLILKEAVR